MTLKECVYDIWELIRKNIADDDSLDYRQIAEWLRQQRALWISNDLNKSREWDESYVQNLGKVELENIDTAEGNTTSSKCVIKRTKVIIPNTIEVHNSIALTRVGPLDFLGTKYKIVPYDSFATIGNGRFDKEIVYASVKDSRVYLKSCPFSIYFSALRWTNIRGIFDNPEEVSSFTNADGTACYDKNSTYPISRKLYTYIRDSVVRYNFPLVKTATEDDINNAKDDN